MFALVESGSITSYPKGNRGIKIGDYNYPPAVFTLWTEQDKTDNKIPDDKDVGDVAVEGLKTKLIRTVKAQAEGILNETDWYITRKAEKSTAIPSAITTHRDACLLYTSPSPRDGLLSRMPSSA